MQALAALLVAGLAGSPAAAAAAASSTSATTPKRPPAATAVSAAAAGCPSGRFWTRWRRSAAATAAIPAAGRHRWVVGGTLGWLLSYKRLALR